MLWGAIPGGDLNMKLCFRLVSLTLASVVALASANAGDIVIGGYRDTPLYPTVYWGGAYAGVNAGAAWSDSTDQLAFHATRFGGVSPSGGFAGGQVGYNWQGMWHPHLVLGVEADIQGAGVDDKGTDRFGDVFKSQLESFGTVRGRIGYADYRSLVYFTAGFAYGEVRNRADFSPVTGPVFAKDTFDTGYALGAGLDYKLSPVWSVRAEYQYINLGKNDPVDISVLRAGPYSQNGGGVRDDAFHTVRFGVNYHLVDGYEPLKSSYEPLK
jgi:outer membrane immunogenic protein